MHQVTLNDIPMTHELLMQVAHLFSEQEGTCLLYSGGIHDAAKKSFLSLFPFDFISIQEGNQLRCQHENPWDALEELVSHPGGDAPIPEWTGYLGYELGGSADPDKVLKLQSNDIPDAYLQRCAVTIVVDHQAEQGEVYVSDQALYFLSEEDKEWVEKLSNRAFWKSPIPTPLDLEKPISAFDLQKPLDDREVYCQKVEAAKELVRSGDIYQVNLSQQLVLSGKQKPFPLFYRLSKLNPAPFSAYLRLKDFAIVSSSPERFLKKTQDILETRPIKGTAPRGKTEDEDARLRSELLASPKERAELLMITDLMRNDLGRVSLPGTVNTEHLWHLEAYTNVFHMVSIIRSRVRSELSPVQILRHCFPGGSITGCPKLRAMEVIFDLEKRSRGIYTGSIGYIAHNGDFDFNIAIRTMLVKRESINIQLGGAIVADSDPEKEYEETLHKGASLFQTLGMSHQG